MSVHSVNTSSKAAGSSSSPQNGGGDVVPGWLKSVGNAIGNFAHHFVDEFKQAGAPGIGPIKDGQELGKHIKEAVKSLTNSAPATTKPAHTGTPPASLHPQQNVQTR